AIDLFLLNQSTLNFEISCLKSLTHTEQARYDFVEMSIDETSMRLDRLKWSKSERTNLQQAIINTGMPIWGLGISAHRKFPLGSASSELRKQGLDILYRSIELAADLGVRVIQIMGYDAFYEPSNADTQARYLEGLQTGINWASAAGILLALENGDSKLVDSVEKAMHFVNKLNSPWFQVYPDIGNMTAAGYDPLEQIPLSVGHLVGVHVKDTRHDELRGVPLGQGTVNFKETFGLLAQMGFTGPLVMEMWAHLDRTGDPVGSVAKARVTLDQWISEAWGD
ncbi:MAG: L-ribulose-5-phosphate 3-epimerase, partial [Anaerolineaceae bacterium]|nr:L-ribulose-5-phosphate 3-epimerase [Anaerolineaceae bacterium]